MFDGWTSDSAASTSSFPSSSASSDSEDESDRINRKIEKWKKRAEEASTQARSSGNTSPVNQIASRITLSQTPATTFSSTPRSVANLTEELDLSSGEDLPSLTEQPTKENNSREVSEGASQTSSHTERNIQEQQNEDSVVNQLNRSGLNASSSSQTLTVKEIELGMTIEEAPFIPEVEKQWYIADVDNFARKGNSIILKANGKKLHIAEPDGVLVVKEFGGRIWLAPLNPNECPNLMSILGTFNRPSKGDRFVEKENRDRTWKTLTGFLCSKGTFREALGGWSKDPEGRGIVVNTLPADFRDAMEGNKSPKAPSAQPAFRLAGCEGGFTKGFFDSTSKTQTYAEFCN